MTPDAMRHEDPARRPRIAILGEFSSGKSTLANVLLGRGASPVRVTATQYPPIWYRHGEDDPVVVGTDGSRTEIEPAELASVALEGTEHVEVHVPAPILARAEIIDMPGSSDPNMSADIWNAVLPLADAVIWCTPATQAWRQSEAAIWDGVDPAVRARSVLLVTRIDKVVSEHDRARLMKRMRRETQGLFRDIFAVDLREASLDPESGAADVVRAALDAILGGGPERRRETDQPRGEAATVLRLEDHVAARAPVSILPRRVTAGGLTAARRPRRTTGSGGTAL